MHILHTPEALIAYRKTVSGTIGLVPTMGALHAGHLSLVQHARDDNRHVITTIFVNPTQFGQGEDFAAYPRTLDADLQKLADAGVDAVFTPTPDTMYPQGYQTYVTVEALTHQLEGAMRPTHFRGVTTIVNKLFNLAQPTIAYFGQKDAQQVCVIRRMVRDLHIPTEIAVIPTAREADGLAMSSRNVYLSGEQRASAVCLSRGMMRASDLYHDGERQPHRLLQAVADEIDKQPLAQIDYIALNSARTLAPIAVIPDMDWGRGDMPNDDEPLLLSLTVRFGKTRLLDNTLLPHHLNTRAGLTQFLGAG
jgi:pantoate--beta-alanine ligase